MGAATIVFDLDGTLVDTAPDLVAALNEVFRRERIPAIPLADAKSLIGGGMRPFIERGLAHEGRSVADADIDLLYADLVAHYAEHIAVHSRLFDGVKPALTTLSREGFTLAVCTNKLEWLARRLLEALRIETCFAAICGGDTFGAPKPDPRILEQTIRRAGGDPDLSVMVGDSETDIRTARNLGIPVIAVDFGYTDVPVAKLGPDRVISHFADLPSVVAELRQPCYSAVAR